MFLQQNIKTFQKNIESRGKSMLRRFNDFAYFSSYLKANETA